MTKNEQKELKGMIDRAVSWFDDIAVLCGNLTSGNVSHLGASIRGMAIRAAEYLKKKKGGAL